MNKENQNLNDDDSASKEEYPDGLQLSQLSKNYAFDPNSLKKNFAIKVKELITESRLKLKLHQLFIFRLRYTGLFKINDLLFYMNKITIGARFKEFFDFICKFDPSKFNGVTISKFLKDDFFSEIPYIRDYFCYSTFPSIFGNFITENSFEEGYNFIKKNFKDINVLPFLVSSFLNHSMLFQDRLISTFISRALKYISDSYRKSIEEEEEEEANDKYSLPFHQNWPFKNLPLEQSLKIFMESFQSCLSYLSQFQIKIVQDLWKLDNNLAIFCISELFLKDILQSLSKNHILSDHTNVLTVDCSVINPPNTAYIIHHNILSEIYNHLDFKKIIQFICDSQVCFQLARIDELIFNDGCDFVFSMSDFKIVQLFYNYVTYSGNNERTILNSIPERTKSYLAGGEQIAKFELNNFTKDSFTINTDFKVYITTNEAPDPKDRTKDEQKMCLETYLVHKFLLSHSGHLHKLQISTDATKAIVNSKILEYINEILFKQNVFDPYEYEKNQIISYLSIVYKSKIATLNSINIDYSKISSFLTKIYNDLNREYKNLAPKDLSEKIFEAMIKDINSRTADKKKLFYVKDDISISNFNIFLRYLIQVSYRLRIAVFNKEKSSKIIKQDCFYFEPTEEDAANKNFKKIDDKVQEEVKKRTKKISQDEYDKHYMYDDSSQEFEDESYDEIQSIIFWSNKALEEDSQFLRSEYNIGQKIQTFVIISKLIKEATKKSDFIINNPKNKRYIFYKIFHYLDCHLKREKIFLGKPNDKDNESDKMFKSRACFYLRANVIKACYYLKLIIAQENRKNLLMQVELNDSYKALSELSDYLGLCLTFNT